MRPPGCAVEREGLLEAVEQAADGVVITDTSGKIEYVNPAFTALTGYSCEEALGQNPRLLKSGRNSAALYEELWSTILSGRVWHGEVINRRKDGSFYDEEMRIAPVRDSAGATTCYIAIKHDVTEQRAAQNAQAFLAAIVNDSEDAIMACTPAGVIVAFNRAARRMFGYSSQEAIGQHVSMLVPPDRVIHLEKVMRELLQGGIVFQYEGVCLSKDGRRIPVSGTGSLIKNTAGEVVAISNILRDVSERIKSEQRLRESEERFRGVFEEAPVGMYMAGFDTRLIQVNEAFCQMLGYSEEEMLGKSWTELRHPDDLPSALERKEQLWSGQAGTSGAECRNIHRTGAIVWSQVRTGLLRSADGSPLCAITHVEDITERKQAEQALKDSEEKFRQLAENIHEVFWMMNAAGSEMIYVGPAYEEIWGRSNECLYANPMDWFEAIHRDDRARAHEKFMRQLKGERVDSEYRIRTPDGQEKWIRDRAFPVRDESGELIRIAGIAEEITERKRSEILLKRTTERLMLATRAGGVGIWSNDLVHRVLEWDEQMFRMYGISRNQFVGVYEAFLAAVHPEDRERLNEENEAAIRGEKEFDSEFRVVWPDGSIHHIRAIALVKRDDAGKAISLVGTSWDITAQKHAAEELLGSNRQLQQETARANRLAIEAERANAAKSEFLANMSHEIRTPMNGVIGMTELLLDTDLNAEQRRYAETVHASGESLMEIINDILDFSKIEAKKLELEMADFDLQNLLDSLTSALGTQAQAKGIELLSIVDPSIPAMLRGDAWRLRQILTNLVGNAIKFTEEGEVVIRATLEQGEESDCLLRFSVRDTGMGIPEDKIGILFDKFSQVDTSTTRRFGGTGLGLAIAKQLVEMMGGVIGVASEEGIGSEFCFTVRLGRSNQPDARRNDRGGLANLSGVRVLIVDDNATSREILAAFSAGWGMRPTAVESGSWALEALYRAREERDPFRIAVIDFHMPGMDGEALGCAIRADTCLADTHMVMMTCLKAWHGRGNPEEIGLAGCVTKPVRRDELCSLLSKVIPAADGGNSGNAKTLDPKSIDTDRESRLNGVGINARILVAEDNPANREVALGILKKLGLRADAVTNGAEAISALESIDYDLVVMDMRMPVMDGIEAARRIRSLDSAVRDHHIPIVAMTANAMESDRRSCLAVGMNDFVAKPVSVAGLRDALKKWLHAGVSAIPVTASPLALSQTTESEIAVFDPASVLLRLEGDNALAQIVFETFLEDLPSQIQALKKFVAVREAAGCARQAHSIRGAAANAGGESLQKLAAEMEAAADAGDWHSVITRMDELERQFRHLSEAIKENERSSRSNE